MRHFLIQPINGKPFIASGLDVEDALHRLAYSWAAVADWQLLSDAYDDDDVSDVDPGRERFGSDHGL